MLYYKINLEKSRAFDGVFFPSFGSDCYEHAITHTMLAGELCYFVLVSSVCLDPKTESVECKTQTTPI